MKLALSVLSLLAVIGPASLADEAEAQAEKPAFELRDGDRVVFLGNTLIERMARYGYVEAALTARWPDRNITFRNLGWSGDTVWAESRGLFDPPAKAYARMLKHVGELQPTVIFLGYGNVEAFDIADEIGAGVKYAEAAKPFLDQYGKLLDDLHAVAANRCRFVLIPPLPRGDEIGGTPTGKYNDVTNALYGSIEERFGERSRTLFADVFTNVPPPDNEYYPGESDDGLHYNARGYRRFARHLGYTLFGETTTTGHGVGLRITDDSIREESRSQHIASCNAAKLAGGLKIAIRTRVVGTPVDCSNADVGLWVDGIPAGTYALRSDEHELARSATVGDSLAIPLVDPQFEVLRKAIVEKNRLYFLKWRPQNVTYLTLFRKHEQGNNAAELAEFDKLVAEKEAEIAKLRQPVKRTYELIRVEADE